MFPRALPNSPGPFGANHGMLHLDWEGLPEETTIEWRTEEREDINQPKKGWKSMQCRGNSMTTSPMVGDAGPIPGIGKRLVWSKFKVKGTWVMGMTAGVRPCRICELEYIVVLL